MALKQENRLLGLKTPLGEDVLVLTAFTGHEEISRLFGYELELLSDNNAISAAEIVGKNVTFAVKLVDDTPRCFNGFVSRFFAGDEDLQGRRNYRAKVVPWLWFLTRTSDCRIFQNKTAVEIIEQIFQDLGFSDYDISQIKGDHPNRDYSSQYRETDFNFVSRLMEEEGIFYFFKHEDGKHTLVLADQKGAYEDCGESEVDYPRDYGTRAVTDHITRWEHHYAFRSGKWAQTDYNFEDHPARSEPTPADLMMTEEPTTVALDNVDKYELYDYPGEYEKKDEGDAYTKIRMEEEEVEHDVVHAAGNCRTFTPGGKFKIKSHRSSSEEGKKFVITSIDHVATEPQGYETGAPAGDDYTNSFTCIPDSVTFRPARTTRRPVVQGLQPAVVTGPAGEEIWPDKYGRVKVQFFWDREGKRDENTSCWVRVSQAYAGKNWGFMCIPRIGQEVLVAFLEGDPDRPIITGRVYNADQMPPYSLPDNKTQSGFKSRSSKEGGNDNFNEIRFEDKKGEEQLFIHAEKNQVIEVEADETHWVGHNQDLTVDNDRTVHVKGAFDETIDAGETRQVTAGVTETIVGGETRDITGDQSETITGALDQTVTAGITITTPATWDLTAVGGAKITAAGGLEIIAPAGVKITAPAGIQTVAPGGQSQVDSWWKHDGNAWQWNFAQKIGVVGIKQEVAGLSQSNTGVAAGMTGVKLEVSGIVEANDGVSMKKGGAKIRDGAAAVGRFAIWLLT